MLGSVHKQLQAQNLKVQSTKLLVLDSSTGVINESLAFVISAAIASLLVTRLRLSRRLAGLDGEAEIV